jgi:hypothetical protein
LVSHIRSFLKIFQGTFFHSILPYIGHEQIPIDEPFQLANSRPLIGIETNIIPLALTNPRNTTPHENPSPIEFLKRLMNTLTKKTPKNGKEIARSQVIWFVESCPTIFTRTSRFVGSKGIKEHMLLSTSKYGILIKLAEGELESSVMLSFYMINIIIFCGLL